MLQVGQILTVRVERVLSFGVFVRLPDGSPGYVRWRELTRGGHWDPAKVLVEGQQVEAVVLALPTSDHVAEVSLRRTRP